MIAIIGVLDNEINALLAKMENVEEVFINKHTYYLGEIDGKSVIVTKSGVGKIMAAMVVTSLVLTFGVSYVINIGTAGSLKKDVNILDVVVVERVAISDFDLRQYNYEQSYDEEKYTFYSDFDLFAKSKLIEHNDLVYGDIVSNDTFITNEKQVAEILSHYPSALCVDMESGATAMVLEHFNLPFIAIRTISDSIVASEDNTLQFQQFEKLASEKSASIAVALVEKI